MDVPIDPAYLASTRFWTRLEDGRVRCDLCPRLCRLREGQRGLCFVRANLDGEIVLTTYGRSSGFCVDPIEKKPLNHFLPGTSVLSFGTAGCNLTCSFCQNWHISKSREMDTLAEAASPEAIARAATDLGCRSVAFTYNDPVVFHEYAIDVAAACRDSGVRTVAVTAGYVCEAPRIEFYRWMDAVNVDLKGFTDSFYRKLATGRLDPVLDTLRYIRHETDTWLEITTLLIPGENDSEAEVHALTRWVLDELGPHVPLHFTAFHPDWRMRHVAPTPPATLHRAREIARKNGIRFAYTGNLHDPEGQTTYCRTCDAVLIARNGYTLVSWRLSEGARCTACGTICDGVFEDRPGRWGSRRQPVSMERYSTRGVLPAQSAEGDRA
jgi:pyruvate formate lyase activating enzyme